MASYTTNDLFPEGGNYKAGDTCDSVDPNAVVPSWIYTGLQWVPNSVNSKVDPVTGGVGILGPDGKQVAGTASPYAFTTRALAESDNGQTRICASAQTATVNASMPVGFGVAFKGAISFTAGSGVTISDVRTSGAANPWCALTQTGVDTYDVVGTKA